MEFLFLKEICESENGFKKLAVEKKYGNDLQVPEKSRTFYFNCLFHFFLYNFTLLKKRRTHENVFPSTVF